MVYRISVDTGGTFTDVIVSDGSGTLVVGKALTTKSRIWLGMSRAIETAAVQLNISLGEILAQTTTFIYGTTRSTNAIVTRNTAKTAFVTTRGFPDILMLKEGGKLNPHDFTQEYPDPYIPRRYTYEVNERIGQTGGVVTEFDKGSASEVIEDIGQRGFEAVAVCFLWSIANPRHELKFGEMLDARLPGIPFTLSHQLVPTLREYRRASATAIDASLKPLMQDHLRELEADLRAAGFAGNLYMASSEGGCNKISSMIERPIFTIGSGPAMAPIAALTYSTIEDMGDNVIVCDTGGTTFDVGLVRDGNLTFTRETWVGGPYIGDLLGISAVDIRSVGAGGGSIAWIDEGGLMRVGPQSAGAEPGPACYGRGGTDATVSDAAVVLGYFDPSYFLGGTMKLDVDAARKVVSEFARRIGCSTEEAAFKILSLASDLMMSAVVDITINEGVNPRESTIVAGGGAAGVNILSIAKELGCRNIVIPKVVSALSASGMQFADVVIEKTKSFVTYTNEFDYDGVNSALSALKLLIEADKPEDVESGDYDIQYIAEGRYQGQVWDLDTPLLKDGFESAEDVEALIEAFHRTHERIFGIRDPGSLVQIVNWKARFVHCPRNKPVLKNESVDKRIGGSALKRDCYFGASLPVVTPIYKASDLQPGLVVHGPAIVEEPTTTIVVYPEMSVEISGAGNYRLQY